jgi:F-type H+-transporting ATPase subunit gamma
MAQIREIRKRMGAVGNIQRITKTMQMIATAKFTAALQRAAATQPYTKKIRHLAAEVAAAAGEISHPLLDGPSEPAGRELLLVVATDRGLCGAYNGNIFRLAMNHLRAAQEDDITVDVEISGKKAAAWCKFQHIDVSQRHTIGDKPEYRLIDNMAQRYMQAFADGRYDAVRVVHMQFVSNAVQKPQIMQLLPLTDAPTAEAGAASATDAKTMTSPYEFSPDSAELLAALLPMTVKTALFQAVNDAVVSEQIMRMVAMKAATENAKELRQLLKRSFNRARQAQITTEISEIVGGTAALE